METKNKKRICITISEDILVELDILRNENYSSRSREIESLIREYRDNKLKQ